MWPPGTTLLTHTVAHSTKPSFMLKTNNQPHKKFLTLALSWAKVVKNGKTLTFKVNFLHQKLPESFYFFFIEEIVEAHFFTISSVLFLLGSSMAFYLKEDLVIFAKMWDPNWVILLFLLELGILRSKTISKNNPTFKGDFVASTSKTRIS